MFNVLNINPGLNDAWFNSLTDSQGFFITVFPYLGAVSLAWFTYDTELPPIDAVSNLGDPGHRWLTAVGPIDGNKSVMEIEMTSGGQRVHDVNLLRERLKEQGLDPEGFNHYLDPFRYGMPPHAGWGLGLDRLAMTFAGAKNVRECVLFPRDRTRMTP